MANNLTNNTTHSTLTDNTILDADTQANTEPATKHDVTEGGVLGAVGGAIVGGLAGGPIGAIIGAVAGGAASAGAVSVVDKHDHDYTRTVAGSHTDPMLDDDDTVDATAAPEYAATNTYGTTPTYAAPSTSSTYTAPSTFGTATGAAVDGEVVVPIVEEEIAVGKREVQSGGARIQTRVVETPVAETLNLREEHVTVDRQPVDRLVTDADAAFQERTYEVTETAEVPVVAKAARVVEEVVIGKTATDRTETVRDTVRRTEVEVEEVDGQPVRPTAH